MHNQQSKTNNRQLFLVPARGGSKGIPGKNVKPFCGEPLVGRTIRQALECCSERDIVLVSTDSIEIKELAESYGLNVPFFRPVDLATDTASTHSVILHALEEFKKRGIEFEKIILLQPTSPFRTIEDIKEAISLWKENIDMVVSVSESKSNPYFNLFEENPSGYLIHSKGDGEYSRRQDAPKVWEFNGAVYVITPKSVEKQPMSKFEKVIPYEMSASRSVDLDTPEDWAIAETLFEKRDKK